MPKPRPLQGLLAVFEQAASRQLAADLRERGCLCDVVESMREVEVVLREQTPDLLLLQLSESETGPVPLDQLRQLTAGMMVVAVAPPDPELFFQAARAGVETVLPLPLNGSGYGPKLDAACARLRARREDLPNLKAGPAPGPTPDDASGNAMGTVRSTSPGISSPSGLAQAPVFATSPVFADSEDMAEVRELIEKVAPTNATVLLRGESGVGKELAARLIHSQSLRASQPFVKVNCAAIPNDLLESELFGYEAGAFTGAAAKGKPGKFEQAHGGTIFLDEIGELHPVLQAKLLHVLQDGEFARLGAKRDTSVDVRVICATNKPLDMLVANGQFREDLYYRINVVAVQLPPLRARTREIPVLADFFLRRYAAMYGKPLVPLPADAMQRLMEYHWPGNIRELENLCKRYVIVGGIEQILRALEQRQERRQPLLIEKAARDLARTVPAGQITEGLTLLEIGRRAAWAAERSAMENVLKETQWNRREAAKLLGISYKALLNKIAQMEQESICH